MVSIAGLVVGELLARRRGIEDPAILNRARLLGAVAGVSAIGVIVADTVAQREADDVPKVTGPVLLIDTPDLVGENLDTAKNTLKAPPFLAADFDVQTATSANDQRGKVIQQNPAFPGKVAPGASWTLTIGLGDTRIDAPDVTGLSLEDAKAKLNTRPVLAACVETQLATSPDNQKGKVVLQNPAAGQPVAPNSKWMLTVGMGGASSPTGAKN